MSAFTGNFNVGTSTTTLIATDRGNSKAVVQWISGEDLFLACGKDAEANEGITLGSTGLLAWEVPTDLLKLGVNGISSGSGCVVRTLGA